MPGVQRRPRPERPWSKPGEWRNRSRIVRVGRLLRTRRPRTFNDKVRYKLLRDHRPLQVTFADKAAMRDHVARVVGAEHLPGLLGLVDDPDDLLELDLPRAWVVKPTHGSGACVVVSDAAPEGSRLPSPAHGWAYALVRPEHVERTHLRDIAAGWLETGYGRGPNHEWAYGQVPRRILVEELLRGGDGGVPEDHKLFVFSGRCHFVQVDTGRFGLRTQDFFDRDWAPLAMTGGCPRSEVPPSRPVRLEEMVDLAERLGAGTDFVRVDLFTSPERVVVGELTSSPAGGDSPFWPPVWNERFGQHWQVPRRYR